MLDTCRSLAYKFVGMRVIFQDVGRYPLSLTSHDLIHVTGLVDFLLSNAFSFYNIFSYWYTFEPNNYY